MSDRECWRAERLLAAASLLSFAAVAFVASMPGCGSGSSSSPTAVDSGKADASAIDSGSPIDTSTRDDGVDSLWTLDTYEESPPDAGAGPVVACGADADASDGGECALPPSTCLDSRWLMSYLSATCVDGVCKWFRGYHDCQADGSGSSCIGGRCTFVVGK